MSQLSIKPNPSVPIVVVKEAEDYLAVFKPAGVPTQPGKGHLSDTVLNGLFAVYGHELQNLGRKRDFGLLHRLDLPVSGVLLVGRTPIGYDQLRSQFVDREIEKTYLCLVHGQPKKSGSVEHPIREVRIKGEKTAQLGPHSQAKAASTKYHLLSSVGHVSLVRCKILTGRLHQIRIHMASLGHPILGDFKYGRRRALDKQLHRNQIALHAHAIRFKPPNSRRIEQVQSGLPAKLQTFVDRLGL